MASAQPELSLLPAKNPILASIDSGDRQIAALKDYNSVRDFYFSSPYRHSFSHHPSSSSSSIPDISLGIKMDRKMVSFVSRTGRHLQRYTNNGCRQVVGCIPYRFRETQEDGACCVVLEVLVVSSQKGKAYMFPKGGWECDESMEEAALRETVEEAGVVGSVGLQLGKWNFLSKSQGTRREGYMFPMLVEEQLDEDWPEKDQRQRIWMKADDAREVCQYAWMKEALDTLIHRLMSSERLEEDITGTL